MARTQINHEMPPVPKTSSLPSEQGLCRCGSAILFPSGGNTMYHAIALVAALTYKCAYAYSSLGCTTDTAVTQTGKRSGNLSFYLGGRSASDRAEWTPNIGGRPDSNSVHHQYRTIRNRHRRTSRRPHRTKHWNLMR